MIQIELAHAIGAIREKVCPARPTAGRVSRGLVFRLRLELSKGDTVQRDRLSLLVGGNSHVFVAEGDLAPRPVDWAFAGAHVSEWRTMINMVLSDLYFKMAAAINAKLGPDKEVAPAAMDQFHRFVDRDDPWQEVVVVTAPDPADPHGYRLKVEQVLPV